MGEPGVNASFGAIRIVDDRPLGLRWHGGVLQYMRHWSEGDRQGHEWVDVPSEPADDAGVPGTLKGQPE